MFGRTYGSGREPALEEWLVHAPRRKLAADENEWAVWYPLRRTSAYYRLPTSDQGRILGEHGKIGAIFGQAGYGNDVRLECFGLDREDNEFVIGLLGPRLDALSRLVKAMRGTEQTAGVHRSTGDRSSSGAGLAIPSLVVAIRWWVSPHLELAGGVGRCRRLWSRCRRRRCR